MVRSVLSLALCLAAAPAAGPLSPREPAPGPRFPAPAATAATVQRICGPELVRRALLRGEGLAPAPATGERFVVPAGAEARIDLAAPEPLAAAGVWWSGDLGEAWLAFLGPNRRVLAPDRILEDGDQAPGVTGTDRPAGNRRVSGLVVPLEGVSVKGLRLLLHGPVDLAEITIVWIHAGDAAGAPGRGREAGAAARAGSAGRSAHAAGSGVAAGGSCPGYPKPFVYARASWGASAPTCGFSYCATTHVGIHHSASASQYNSTSWAQCASNVKSIQTYHMVTNGWCDIGYNYVICKHGDIFEGRAGGDDVVGAHDGFNCGSMGTCFMGYHHPPYNQPVTQATQDAVEELGAWKCCQQGIDPLGSSWYQGYAGVMQNIYGHRDVKATACPGDLAYALLPAIRSAIDAKLNGGKVDLILDNDQAGFAGVWATGTSAPDKYGPDYRWTSTGYDWDLAIWRPSIPVTGTYDVKVWWSQGANRNPWTYVGVLAGGVLDARVVNQQMNGGQWNTIGTYTLPQGSSSVVAIFGFGAPGWVVIADAIRLTQP